MRKNVAGQNVAGQMNSATDGSALTTGVSVFVTIDGGTQTAGAGTATSKGNGHWNYAPTQAETNGNHLAFTFTHASGVNQTINVYTVSFDPHDTVRLGLTALPNAAAEAAGGLYTRGSGAGQINQNANGQVDTRTVAMAADVVTASALATDAVAEIADGVWDEDATGHQTLGTFGQAIGDPVADTNTIYKAVVTDATGATVGVDVVAVKAETASIQTDTDDIQARLPAALVGGRIDSSVGAMAASVVTAAAIATDAIGADEFAQGAADKVWSSASRTLTSVSGLTIAANLTQILGTALTETLAGYLAAAFKKFFDIAAPVFTTASVNQTGDSFARLGAPAGASVSVDVAAVKAETAAIKAKTDSLTFSLAGNLDANLQSIDEQVTTGNNATLKLKQLHVINNAGDAILARSTGGDGNGLTLDGIGYGMQSSGQVTGIYAYSSIGPGHGIYALGSAGHGINLIGDGAGGKSINAPQGIAPDDGINLNVGSIADKLLGRSLAGGADGGRTVRQALRILRNLRQIVAGVLTVYREDDVTPDWTASVTQTPGDPVSKIDPT